MKRFIPFLLFFVLIFTGCERKYDINDRLIVQGVGIDYLSENEVEVTVQALNTETYAGIGGTKVPDKLVNNYYLKGKSVADALSKLVSFAGREPLYTHTRIVLLGKTLAEKGIDDVIDFFSRDSSCHASLFVAVCDKTAKETLSFDPDAQSVPAVDIENSVKAAGVGAYTVNVHIFELIKMYREETTSVFLPVVSLIEAEGEKAPSVNKIALFKGEKAVRYIDGDSTQFLLLFLNCLKTGTYTLENYGGGDVSFDYYSSKCKTNVLKGENGKTVFNVKLKIGFDCVEYTGKNELNIETQNELERMLERELSERMKSFLYGMCNESIDCMRLGRILLIKDKNVYKNKKDDWETALKEFEINVTAKVNIRRIGQESGKSAI
ncbi:MAG: Ger(x)C family spore germination protein [Ruminococcaceae bacterium]|nr:Ger(x)C family spore germination protein [Oscillospiraceae bacterium]